MPFEKWKATRELFRGCAASRLGVIAVSDEAGVWVQGAGMGCWKGWVHGC